MQPLDLLDPTLFGNDAAEDEKQDVFDAYLVERDEVRAFLDPNQQLRVIRAYKGEGKTAILRGIRDRLADGAGDDSLIVNTTGPAIAPAIQGTDPDQWTRGWKQSIFQALACEIGATIGKAWSDDAMSLVEEAERHGFRSRSFASSVLDRLSTCATIPIKRELLGVANPEKVVQRWMKDRPLLWVLVDDVDENFQNLPAFRAKLAAFFSACRQIMGLVPEVRIRAGIRPNVWAILRSDAESLSKVEQYVVNLGWTPDLMRGVLAKRVEGYLRRNNLLAGFQGSRDPRTREEQLISMVFEERMMWGKDATRPPHVVMATLSRNRPRWMIELAKAAAARANAQGHGRIGREDIVNELEAFGRRRIADTSAEFSP